MIVKNTLVTGFQEQLSRTHGQNQVGVEEGEGGEDGWGEGERWGVNQTTVLEQ